MEFNGRQNSFVARMRHARCLLNDTVKHYTPGGEKLRACDCAIGGGSGYHVLTIPGSWFGFPPRPAKASLPPKSANF